MWLIVEYKLLEKEDLELMKEIIEDDDIEFDLEKMCIRDRHITVR